MRYIIDSYAWLEYFMGTEAGRGVKEIIDSEADEKLTPSICLAETYAKILKTEDEKKAELRRASVKSKKCARPTCRRISCRSSENRCSHEEESSRLGLG